MGGWGKGGGRRVTLPTYGSAVTTGGGEGEGERGSEKGVWGGGYSHRIWLSYIIPEHIVIVMLIHRGIQIKSISEG